MGLSRAINAVDGFESAWFAGRFGSPQAVVFSRTHGNRRVRQRLGEFAPMLLEHAERLP